MTIANGRAVSWLLLMYIFKGKVDRNHKIAKHTSFKGILGVGLRAEVASFIPRAVLSPGRGRDFTKHMSFKGLFGLTHDVGKRWLLSFQETLVGFIVMANCSTALPTKFDL